MRGTPLLLLFCGSLLLALPSCKKKRAPASEPTEKPLPDVAVPPGAVAPVKAILLRELQANRSRKCLRPVLFGSPIKGNADAAQIAITAPDKRFIACNDALNELGPALVKRFHHHPPPAFLPSRPLVFAKALPPSTDPELEVQIAKLKRNCATVIAAFHMAQQHEDSCSAYLAGRNSLDDPNTVARLAMAYTWLTRLDRGITTADALSRLLKGLRVAQDLDRGGTSFLMSSVSLDVSNIMVLEIEQLLNRRAISGPLATQMRARVDALIASAPTTSGHFRGERQSIAMVQLLLLEPSWSPPGGRWWFMRPQRQPRAQSLGLWRLMERLHRAAETACDARRTAASCIVAARKLAADIAADRGTPTLTSLLSEAFTHPAYRKAMRKSSAALLDDLQRFPAHHAHRLFYLGAIRLHLAIIADASTRKRWPTLVEASPLLAKYPDPTSGKPLQLKSQKKIWTVTSASPLAAQVNDSPPLYVIAPQSGK